MTDTVSITALAKTLKDDNALTTWSDEKKKDFVGMYNLRVAAARYILTLTADTVWEKARAKHFVGYTMERDMRLTAHSVLKEYGVKHYDAASVFKHMGRSLDELNQIAQERADTILKSLPPLKSVVEILSPDMTEKLTKIDRLRAKLKTHKEALDEMGGPIAMSDYPDDMTLLEFRTMVKDREKARRKHTEGMKEAGEEAAQLQSAVDRFLYKGVPGLDKAVLETCTELVEQAIALGTSSRRVEESLIYGDSELAAGLLSKFETDEQKVTTDVAKRFTAALDTLKMSRGAVRKQLSSKRKAKKSAKK